MTYTVSSGMLNLTQPNLTYPMNNHRHGCKVENDAPGYFYIQVEVLDQSE